MGLNWPPKNKKVSKKESEQNRKTIQYAEILSRIEDGDTPENIARSKHMPCPKVIREWLKNGGPTDRIENKEKKGYILLTEEVFDRILQHLANGITITEACKQEEISRPLFYAALQKKDGWIDKYREAQELFHEFRMDRAYELAEGGLEKDGVHPARLGVWFQIHKFGMQRAGASRFNQARMSDGDDNPIKRFNPEYVDSGDSDD